MPRGLVENRVTASALFGLVSPRVVSDLTMGPHRGLLHDVDPEVVVVVVLQGRGLVTGGRPEVFVLRVRQALGQPDSVDVDVRPERAIPVEDHVGVAMCPGVVQRTLLCVQLTGVVSGRGGGRGRHAGDGRCCNHHQAADTGDHLLIVDSLVLTSLKSSS